MAVDVVQRELGVGHAVGLVGGVLIGSRAKGVCRHIQNADNRTIVATVDRDYS